MACARGCCATPRDHYLSVGISSTCLPNKGGPITAIKKREESWEKDMPAYKALREQGLQPPRIDGSAELASKAETKFEINRGKPMPKKVRNAFEHVTETDVK